MPSLQMKMKSTMGCLREKNGLHVCQKSIKISKNSLSHFRNFPQKTQLDTCISNKKDADSFCSDETNCCELLEEESIQDHTEANCSSTTIETIFSPNTDSNDNDSEATASSNTGNEKDLEVASSSEDKDSESTNTNSHEYQICNISDFFISDMTVTTESTSLPDYQCNEESTIFFDDDYMILPFLEDSCNTDSTMVSQQSGLYLAIQQLKSHNQETELNNTYPEWDPSELLNPQMFVRNLPELSEVDKKTVTLALDLDETLVHSSLEYCEDADFTFSVYFDFKEHTVYVKQRPYLKEFLERVSEMFQVVIFTASQSIYAKQLLDILDPDGKIISKRAYRDSCIFTNGIYTKDLTVLGVDLSKVVIVDNCPQVFQLQVNNGIPIKSWFSDPSDCALITLLPFLETLANAEDVRPIIAKRFGNKE